MSSAPLKDHKKLSNEPRPALKVLHLITSLNRGGVEIWLMNLLRVSRKYGLKMDFCCKGKDVGIMAEEAKSLGASIFHVPLKPSHIRYIKELRNIIIQNGYNLVHNHLEAYSGVPTYVCRNLSVPILTSFHNVQFEPQTWTALPLIRQVRAVYSHFSVDYSIKKSNAVTGCSRGVIEALKIEEKRSDKNIHALYYGLDFANLPDVEEKNILRKQYNISNDDKIILHVGRFVRQKNHLGVINIFKIIKESVKDAKLFLVGDGPLREEVKRYVIRSGLYKDVSFLGIRDDVRNLMACSDVFIFPSLFEGFGLAAIEASAIGLPVVGSDVVGLREAVKQGETGFLFPPREIGEMAKCAIRLLKDSSLCNEIGRNGKAWAREEFSLEKNLKKLLALYHEYGR